MKARAAKRCGKTRHGGSEAVRRRCRLFVVLAALIGVGMMVHAPHAHAQRNPGDSLVIDGNAGTAGRGALFRVNGATGQRTVLSDFGNASQGAGGLDPVGVALESSGDILVIDEDAGTAGRGALFRVNGATGQRTVLSDFGNTSQGAGGLDPVGVVVAPIPTDTDNDDVSDDEDECPDSDLRPTVIIDGCHSGVTNAFNILDTNGCTIADLIGQIAESASDHDEFVSDVANLTNDLKAAGVISGNQKGAIQSCAGGANIP